MLVFFLPPLELSLMHSSRTGPFSFDVEEVRMSSRRLVIAGRRGARLIRVVTRAVWTTCSLWCSSGDLKGEFRVRALAHVERERTQTHPFARCHSAEDEEELAPTLSPFIPRTSSNPFEGDELPPPLAAISHSPCCPSELE